MRNAPLVVNFALAFLAVYSATVATSRGQLLHDDFNGSSINTSLWQIATPFPNSSMTESGGNAVFENRGRLLSVASLPASVDVTGSFEFTGNIHDQFTVVLRTNGASRNPAGSLDNGIYFNFAIESDTGSTANQIHIRDELDPNPEIELATGTFPMALNIFYNFRITDDGTNLALYINDLANPVLTATDSNSYGSHLGLFNREGNGSISAGSVTQLDYLTVVLLLRDAFNGNSINTNLWQTSVPFAGSSITESGGNAIFENRGRLITVGTYPAPTAITGAFTITGANSDEFKLVIRTDGTFVNDQFGESANGFMIRFRSNSFFASDEVSIQEIGGHAFSGWTGVLNTKTEYAFKVVDDGATMSVFLGDLNTAKLTLVSTNSHGNKLVFYNREQTGSIMHQTHLDYVSVAPPTPTVKVNSIAKLPNGHVLLQCYGVPLMNHTVQATTDLTQQFTIITRTAAGGDGTFQFDDANASNKRFYRITYP